MNRPGLVAAAVASSLASFADESSRWSVRYYTSGYQCTEAGKEFERKGRELRVSFQRVG